MSFEIRSGDVDPEAVLAEIRRRIEEKKRSGLLTDAEIAGIAGHRLQPVLDPSELRSRMLAEFRTHRERWNYTFDPETVYRSSRGAVGALLLGVRRLLRPIQKLFWNPTPMIAALSRQSELNDLYLDLLHSFAVEVTRLNLEVTGLKNRVLELQARLDLLQRREKTLESLVEYRDGPDRA